VLVYELSEMAEVVDGEKRKELATSGPALLEEKRQATVPFTLGSRLTDSLYTGSSEADYGINMNTVARGEFGLRLCGVP
jgi:hypothetical protein